MSGAPRKLLSLGIKLALVATLGLLVACGGGSNAASSQDTSPSPSASPPALKNLKVAPDTGHAGDSFTVSGEALPPGKPVEFVWVTSDGDYVTQVELADVKFIERAFPEKRVSLGKSQTDSQGRVSATFTAPDDYGETHDILAVLDGQDTAKGGFRIMRTVDFSPTQGPVGIPITITIKGLGPKTFESTMAALYDHKYTGFITAVKTKGTAVFQIRAAGPVGPHLVESLGPPPPHRT